MLPLIAFGVGADCLENVTFSAGPLVTSQAGLSPTVREAIAFCYRLGASILLAVIPAVLWVLLHRRLLYELRSNPAS